MTVEKNTRLFILHATAYARKCGKSYKVVWKYYFVLTSILVNYELWVQVTVIGHPRQKSDTFCVFKNNNYIIIILGYIHEAVNR